MKNYKPSFNFLIPILRIGYLAFIGWVLTKWMPVLVDKRHAIMHDWLALLYLAFVLAILTLGCYHVLKGLVTQTLIIQFSEEGITVWNLVVLTKYFIPKPIITKIYSARKQMGRATWKTINIYTTHRKGLELIQFNYLDFRRIMPAIDKMMKQK